MTGRMHEVNKEEREIRESEENKDENAEMSLFVLNEFKRSLGQSLIEQGAVVGMIFDMRFVLCCRY
jgi:hypothetical protein